MRRVLILWHIFILPWLAYAQNCGIVDTILIGTNRTVTYNFEVTDVVNDDLADPNQGICGIEIEFLHQFSENMELWITSPSGQMVQLIGSNTSDALAFTFAARWDITFVPCAATAIPDSGYVAQWDNNQPRNFISGGRYTGSYYPYDGCLEDFDTGPVNGQWTITIRNNPSVYQGAVVGFRLRLCDERGFLCCFADAGSLASYPDVTSCEGNDTLQLNIPPVYTGLPPDTAEYAYTYLISQNDILLAYDSVPDLRGLAAGTYQVCGLSYKKTDIDSFPLPNSVQTLSQLRQQLNGNLLLYCGKITNDCINVTITPQGDTTFVTETICQGESYAIGNQTFTTTGEYDVTITGADGCSSTTHLSLTVLASDVINLNETLCVGDSIQVGNSIYKTSGIYRDTLTNVDGCDSIINLNLTVLDSIITNINASICAGGTYTVGNQNFTIAGSYTIPLTSALGCDSIVNLRLTVLNPSAVIASFGTLDCFNASVTLDGSGSTPAGVTFRWLNASGVEIGNTSTVNVTSPGTYFLEISQSSDGIICRSQNSVIVNQNTQNTIVAAVANPPSLSCTNAQITLNGSGSTQGAGITYLWNGPGILSGGNTLMPVVNQPGTYQLIVASSSGLCADTATVTVNRDVNTPIADAGNGDTLNCTKSSVTIGGGTTSTGPNITYRWQTNGGSFVGATNTRTVVVNAPGDYTLIVTDTNSGCTANDITTVIRDTIAPIANAGEPDTITCSRPDALLNGNGSSTGQNFRYTWTTLAGALIGNDITETVTQPGKYVLQVLNVTSGCSSRDSVDIAVELGVPTITFGESQISCDSNFLNLQAFVNPANGTYAYAWNGPGLQSPPDQPTVRVNAAGDYILTVRNLQNDCIVTDTISVTAQSCDVCVQGLAPDTLNCSNAAVTLQATLCDPICTDCTITWMTLDGNFVSGTDGLTPIVDAPGTYTITLTNSSNFSASVSFVVLENIELPIVDPGNDATITCTQPSVTIGGSGTSSGAQYTYTWTSANGSVIMPNNSTISTVNQSDIYYLEVLNTLTGCRAIDSVIVRIDTFPPIAEAGPSAALTCNASLATLDGTGSSTGSNFTYVWTTSQGSTISGVNTLMPTVNAAGTYFLIVTDTLNGCSAMDSVIVTSDDLPVIPAIADTALNCINESVLLNGILPNNGNFSARWCELDNNDNPINCKDSLSITVSTPGRYRFEVTNTDNGCSASRVVNVQDNRVVPIVDAGTSDTLGCNQPDLTLNGMVTPSNGNYTYQWSAGNGSPIQNPTTLAPTISLPDTYILVATNLDNGCVSTDSVEILANTEAPVVFAGFDTTLNCATTSIRLNPQVIGNNLQYQWTTPDGNISSGADSPNPTVDAPGFYILNVTNIISGCSEQDTVQVSQNADKPTALIANANNLSLGMTAALVGADYKNPEVGTRAVTPLTCTRDETIIDASISSAGGDFVVQWTDPSGVVLSDTDLMLNATQAGNYQLRITSLVNGCSDSIQVNVPIDTMPPTISIAPPTSLDCEVTETQLVASASGGNNFTYAWTTQNGEILTGQNSANATVGKSGNYTVAITRADNGCTGEASILVEAIESAIEQVFFTILKPNCFERGSATVTIDSVQGGAAPYLYSLFDSPFTTRNVFENLATGTYDLAIQDRNGCEWESQVTIPAPDTIQVQLSEDVEIDLGDSTELVATIIPADFISIVWKSAGEADTSNLQQRIVTPPRSTTYFVEVTGTNGCVAIAKVTVFVNETIDLFIPNVFSPNGDGINDVFMPFAGQNVKNIKMFMIFDRWGDRVYIAGRFNPMISTLAGMAITMDSRWILRFLATLRR
ncbi:MAG: gliding motility-associated C-terminal domain-containing protein [Saprospiraceae bacterium]|nr:gliding motility-associated C-terminal domain-containing protein [Saprospiraceae bacterium]